MPPDLDSVLEKQTEKGYRVIAVGYRTFPAIDIIKLKRLQRDEVECDLTFAGLIIFENKLKEQTSSVINGLRKAQMKIVMLTGSYFFLSTFVNEVPDRCREMVIHW